MDTSLQRPDEIPGTSSRQVWLRWSDLDSMGHVNNVAYISYFDLGWPAESNRIWGSPRVGGIDVSYLRPIGAAISSVQVHSVTDGSDATAKILLPDGEIAAEGRYTLGPVALDQGDERGVVLSIPLRPDDLDSRGDLRRRALFELLQEARIRFSDSVLGSGRKRRFVVRTQKVRVASWSLPCPEIVSVRSCPVAIGTRSLTMRYQVECGGIIVAQADTVLVGFDAESDRSRVLGNRERERLRAVMQE